MMREERTNSITLAQRDRAYGCLLGLAVGDALGTTLEFQPRDARPLHTEMTGGGVFNLEAGYWTDDTSMALCLADSLIACPSFDRNDLMRRFIAWWRKGENSPTGTCFDIGNTTADALHQFEMDGTFASDRAASARSAGNGSLMRLAPAVLHTFPSAETAQKLAVDQSRVTHGSSETDAACSFFANLLTKAISGLSKDELLGSASIELSHSELANISRGDWKSKTRASGRDSQCAPIVRD